MAEILQDIDLVDKPIWIQCTWANAFSQPEFKGKYCLRSYDRNVVAVWQNKDDRYFVEQNIIATFTGNYYFDEKDEIWFEANLKYMTGRLAIGWFRFNDIYFEGKDAEKNKLDEIKSTTTKKNWLAWLTAGLAAYNIFG